MNNRFLECLILPSIDTSKYLILAPDANHQAWWEAPKEVQLVRLLEQTKRNWPVKNIITIGYSDGGTGSAFLLCNYPELIDAALPIAGYYFEGCTYSNPTYVIHGIRDEVFNYSRSHNIMERAQDNSGSNLLFNAIENLTHTQPCLYIPHVRKGMEWIEARLKSKAFHP